MARQPPATVQSAEAEPGAARVVVERPPPGLARGQYAWPAWAIGGSGAALVALGLAYLLWRFRRAARR